MIRQYVLDEHGNPVEEPDLRKWAMWLGGNGNRRLKEDRVGPLWVSTIFLGIDHNFTGNGPPVLWETMIFGDDDGWSEHYCDRYSSREAAYEGHRKAVEHARAVVAKGKAVKIPGKAKQDAKK